MVTKLMTENETVANSSDWFRKLNLNTIREVVCERLLFQHFWILTIGAKFNLTKIVFGLYA